MPHKKSSDTSATSKGRTKGKKNKESTNPWPYLTTLTLVLEKERLDKKDLATLCCRLKYCVKSVMITDENHWNNEVYRIFGELVDKDYLFMRQWLRCYNLMNKNNITKIAKECLKSKGLKLKTWLISIKTGRHADILALYLLCVITKSHCYVHLHDGNYWSSLEEQPSEHATLEQKCNLHLAYMGNRNYAPLILQTVTVQYEIFGVPDPYEVQEMDTKPQILGTLTFDENETLDKLMGTELNTMSMTQLSASAGSQEEIPQVKWELGVTSHSKGMEPPPPKIEPLLSIYKLTSGDVQKIKDKLKSRSQQSLRTPQCRLKKSKKGTHAIKEAPR